MRTRLGGPRLVVGLLATLAAVALTGPGEAAAIPTCSPVHHEPPKGDAGHGPAPLLIGDSVTGFAIPELQRVGYRINGQGCRTFPRGIKALKREAHRRPLPDFVVFELGTAGDVKNWMIAKVLDILGPDRALGLVTPRTFFGGIDPDAALYHAAAARDPRIRVIPWAEWSDGNPGWLLADNVHPTDEGIAALTWMLKAFIPNVPPASSASPPGAAG